MSAPPVVAERESPAATRSPAMDAPGPGADGQPALLTTVPRPQAEAGVALLSGLTAGGLQAVMAHWGPAGGEVVLSGAAPFVDLTGRAGFRADGTLDGTVTMRARVSMLGLPLADATWAVAGWQPEVPLAGPDVRLRGTTLHVDLATLPPDATLAPAAGLEVRREGLTAAIELPTGVAPAGQPLQPRIAELFSGLLGTDVSGLSVHPDAAVDQAPAFVSDGDLFFAPGRYGVDGPESARLLDAAIRAALAGAFGPVASPTDPPPGQAPREEVARPVADTTVIPAVVPEALAAATGAGAAPAGPGPEGAGSPAGTGQAAPAEQEGAAQAAEAQAAADTEAVQAQAAGEEGAAGAGAAAEAPAEPTAPVEVLMPEAPTDLTPAAAARGGGVAGGARRAAGAARDVPSAQATVDDARGAVEEPVAETAARAREAIAAELGAAPAPSPEIVELCERIRTAIYEQRPEDEDELLRSDPTQAARDAGSTITGSVETQVDQVGGAYDAMSTPPAGSPALTPAPLDEVSPTSPGMGVDAAAAAPDPIPAENLSLDADVASTDQRIADSGIDTTVTQEIPDGPFAQARSARGELGELAQQTPEELAAQQQQAIESSQADMAELQLQATAALRSARRGTVADVGEGRSGMVTGEQATRESVGARAQQIYDTAERAVTDLLTPLSRTAIARWEAGLAQLSGEFNAALARVQRWIDDRHSGVLGTIVAVGDYIAGLPDWVTDEYDRAERAFGDGVCDLLLEISTDVNGVIGTAQAIIQTARDDIDEQFTAMEEQFPEWAAQERARFARMLDGLDQRATDAQTSFVRDVSARAITAVNEAHAAVEAKRQEAGGLIGQVIDAINEFIEDPVRAIINGLLRVVGIPPAAFWGLIARIEQVIADIADDPVSFLNNLVAGVKQGFQQFFDNFGTWALRGFWDWLFSGLETPIPMPRDMSPGALFSFALQLMGITWPRVREILVRHVGPTAVEVIEAAWQLISVLIERGPDGIVELIREQLTPQVIVQTILEAAVEYLVETLIQQVVVRVIGMLNPAGAIIQAIDLIYQVCSWIFRNAARIFRFVEAVVNGIADVVAGNIGGLATAVERALGSLIPPVIDFLAGLLHLGGLPGQVAEVIVRLQATVYQVMDTVIGFLAEQGRALLRAVGIGGEDEEQHDGNADEELGTTVRFSAGGESHRLWFDVAGQDATLMVASSPQPVQAKIAEWRGMLEEGRPADEALRAEASTTLGNLATVANEADADGDRLARLFLEAARSQDDSVEPPSDDALENRQRAIAGMLDRLFTIFGGAQDTQRWLADMAGFLPAEGQTAMDAPYRDWALRIPEFTIGNQPDDERIWPVGTLDGTRAAAEGYIAAQPTHRLLLPYFQTAPGQRDVRTAAFSDYVFVQAAGHPVRQGFRTRYGNAAVDRLKSTAAQTVGASTRVDQTYKDRLLTQVNRMAFHWDSPGGGRIEFPTERVPDHTRYRPLGIQIVEANGTRTITYSTATGQTFTSTTSSSNGLTMTVTGRDLRFMTGRGVTEDSPAFTSGNGFDRSHIIANEFGGTGFSVGGNLVTASSQYNQQVMRGAEIRVGNAVRAFAATHGRDETTVSFTMTVTVTFGALRDPAALAMIKQQSWFPADRAGADLDAEILARINAGEVHPDLMRITGVTYQWTSTDPAGGGGAISIGPDLWLLMNG